MSHWPVRADGRRCSMTSVLAGPHRCASGDCGGQRRDCSAKRANEREATALTAARVWLAAPDQEWENAWLRTYGLSALTLADSPFAGVLERQSRYGTVA